MRRAGAVTWLLLLLASAVCSLGFTEAQRRQLDSFRDGGHFDQAGLYPVLRAAAAEDPAADAEPAVVVEPAAFLERPAELRGRRVWVRAWSAGRARRLALVRSGGWPNPIPEWGLQLGENPDDAVPAVLLLAGEPGRKPPRAGSVLRFPAWFVGLWGDADASGTPRRYPVFVAQPDAVPIGEAPAAASPLPALLGGLAVLGVGVFLLRRLTRRAGLSSAFAARVGPADDGLDVDTELPADPAEAMRVLAAQADDSETPPPGGAMTDR